MNKIPQIFTTFTYVFIGAILTLIILKIKMIKIYFLAKAPLIKKYWIFVIPFILLSSILYVLVFYFSTTNNLNNNLTVLNQAITLIFAIFVGYFAFQQVVENRFDKLKEQGHLYFKQQSYLRAIEYYEEAYLINSRDFSLLAELLELYLSIQNFNKFNEKIHFLEKLRIEDYEWSTLYYLKIAQCILKKDFGSAEKTLKEYLKKSKKDPLILMHFNWDFSDIRKCEPCKLLKGELKTIFDNLIVYLNKGFDDVKRLKFENGDYLLKENS